MQISKYIRFILILILVLNIKPTNAQFVEIGIMGGASNYSGDLSDESVAFKETHLAGALFGRYNFTNRWAVKGFAGYGKISGDDKNYAVAPTLSKPAGNFQYWRNLHFRIFSTSRIQSFTKRLKFIQFKAFYTICFCRNWNCKLQPKNHIEWD